MNAQNFDVELVLGKVTICAYTWEDVRGYEPKATITYSDLTDPDNPLFIETDNIPANTIVYIIHAGMMNGASVILQKMREHGAS